MEVSTVSTIYTAAGTDRTGENYAVGIATEH